jgi:hypothetical protein
MKAVIKCAGCGKISYADFPIEIIDSKCDECDSWCSESVIGIKGAAQKKGDDKK